MATKQNQITGLIPKLTIQTNQKSAGSIKPLHTVKTAIMTLRKYKICGQTTCRIEGSTDGYDLIWFRLSDSEQKTQTDLAQQTNILRNCRYTVSTEDQHRRAYYEDMLLISPGDLVLAKRQKKHATEDLYCYIATFQAAYLDALSQQLFRQNADLITGKAKSWSGLTSQIIGIEQEYRSRLPGHPFMLNNLCAQLAIDILRSLHRHRIDQRTSDDTGFDARGEIRFIPHNRTTDRFLTEREVIYTCRDSDCKREDVFKQEKMRQIAQDIRSNCGYDICVAGLSAKYQMHPSYLCRSFRTVYHKTILEYRTECRIELACLLLGNEDLRITQIAALCGYRSVSRFSGQFKKLTGLTPTQYRFRLYEV